MIALKILSLIGLLAISSMIGYIIYAQVNYDPKEFEKEEEEQ